MRTATTDDSILGTLHIQRAVHCMLQITIPWSIAVINSSYSEYANRTFRNKQEDRPCACVAGPRPVGYCGGAALAAAGGRSHAPMPAMPA
jgi:hypothetical protein